MKIFISYAFTYIHVFLMKIFRIPEECQKEKERKETESDKVKAHAPPLGFVSCMGALFACYSWQWLHGCLVWYIVRQ